MPKNSLLPSINKNKYPYKPLSYQKKPTQIFLSIKQQIKLHKTKIMRVGRTHLSEMI